MGETVIEKASCHQETEVPLTLVEDSCDSNSVLSQQQQDIKESMSKASTTLINNALELARTSLGHGRRKHEEKEAKKVSTRWLDHPILDVFIPPLFFLSVDPFLGKKSCFKGSTS